MATRTKPVASDPPGEQQPGPGWGVAVNGAGDIIDTPEDEESVSPLVDRIRAAFAQNPEQNSKLRLFRVNKDKKLGWCDDFTPQEFDDGFMDEVRSKWGPGKYQLRMFGAATADPRRRGLLVNETFSIESPTMGAMQAAAMQQAPQQTEGTSRTELLLERLLEKMAAPPPDPMTQMAQMFSLMEGMRKAMGPPPDPVPPTNPLTNLQDSLAILRELRVTAKEVADDTPPAKEDSLLSIAGPLIGNVLDAIKAQQGQPQAPQHVGPLLPVQLPASIDAATPAPPQAQPPRAVPQQPPETMPEMNLQLLMLGGAVARLVALAKEGTPEATEQAAEFAASELPEEYLPLLDHQHDGKRWPLLAQALPAPLLSLLAPHQAWVETVLTRAAVLLDEGDNVGDDPSP